MAASFLQMTDIVQACYDFIKAALDISIKPDASDEPGHLRWVPRPVVVLGRPHLPL